MLIFITMLTYTHHVLGYTVVLQLACGVHSTAVRCVESGGSVGYRFESGV